MVFSFVDFFIGLTLVNSIPHFVLGIWKGRMFSGLGFGNRNNILYGILNFCFSIELFIYHYSFNELLENSIYIGGAFVVVAYFAVGKMCYTTFHKNHVNKEN